MRRWGTSLLLLAIGLVLGYLARGGPALEPDRGPVVAGEDVSTPESSRPLQNEEAAPSTEPEAEPEAPPAPLSPGPITHSKGEMEDGRAGLHLRLIDAAGHPVADREFSVCSIRGASGNMIVVKSRTGADGLGELPRARPGPVEIQVSVPGGMRKIRTYLYAGWTNEVRVPVPGAGVRIVGRAVDVRTGAGIANATVEVTAHRGVFEDHLEGRTDENGDFAIEGLSAGPAIVSVTRKIRTSDRTVRTQVSLPTSGELRCDFGLCVVNVSGVVTRTEDGAPLGRALITATDFLTRGEIKVGTDEHGAYELIDLPAAYHELTVSLKGYCSRTARIDGRGENRRLDFQLTLCGALTVRLYETTGVPFTGYVNYHLSAVKPTTGGTSGSFIAGPGNPIEIRGLAPGRYELRVWRADGKRPVEGKLLEVNSGPNDVRVEM